MKEEKSFERKDLIIEELNEEIKLMQNNISVLKSKNSVLEFDNKELKERYYSIIYSRSYKIMKKIKNLFRRKRN